MSFTSRSKEVVSPPGETSSVQLLFYLKSDYHTLGTLVDPDTPSEWSTGVHKSPHKGSTL